MQPFDLTGYLNSQSLGGTVPDSQAPVSKQESIFSALEQKQEELLKASLRNVQRLRENSDSWTTKLGLQPDSGLGMAVNAGAGVLATGSRMLGETAAFLPSMAATVAESQIPPYEMALLKRRSSGETLSPEEEAVINRELNVSNINPLKATKTTPLSLYEGLFGFENLRRGSQLLREKTDISSIVNNTETSKLMDDLVASDEYKGAKDTFITEGKKVLDVRSFEDLKKVKGSELASAVGTLAQNVLRAGADNPVAVFQAIAENVPNTVLAIASKPALVAAMAGYSQSYYDKWSDNFANNYEARGEFAPREPTASEKAEALATAASLGAAEGISDVITGGAVTSLKAPLKAATKGIAEAAAKTGTSTTAAVAKGLVGVSGRVVGAGAEAAIGELPTEAYQTAIEGLLEKGELPSFDEIYQGGALGALAGGGTGAGGRAIVEAVNAVSGGKDKLIQQSKDFKAAVDKADITGFIKPDVMKTEWVNAADVLVQNVNKEGSTLENAESNLKRIDTEVLRPLDAEITKREQQTTEGRQAQITELDTLHKEKLATLTNPTEIAAETVKFNEQVAELSKPVDSAIEKQALKELKPLRNQMQEVLGLVEGLKTRTKPLQEEAGIVALAKSITAPVEAANTAGEGTTTTTATNAAVAPSEASTKAAGQLIVRAMSSRGKLTEPAIQEIEKVAASGVVDAEQAAKLKVITAEARALLALKNSDVVQQEIQKGTKDKGYTPLVNFKGMLEWSNDFDNSSTEKTKVKNFEGLKNLIKVQASKAKALEEATVGQFVIQPKENGEYVVVDKIPDGYTRSVFNTSKGITGARNTATKIRQGLAIGQPILDGMALRLNLPVSQTNVQKTTQAQQTSQKGSEVSGTAETGTGAQQTSTGTASTEKVTTTPKGEKNGVQKQGQKTTQTVTTPNNPNEIVTEDGEIIDTAPEEFAGEDVPFESLSNNPTAIADATAAVLEERDNVQQTTPPVVQGTQETNTTTAQNTGNTGSSQTGQEQESGSNTRDNRPSSQTTGTTSVEETSLTEAELQQEMKILSAAIVELRKVKSCLLNS